jgi:N-carbamoylputrescine amidase
LKIALIQQKYLNNKQQTIDQTKLLIKQASNNGANLILLQELHTNSYFCQTQNIEHFSLAEDYLKEIEIFSKIAKKYKIVLVVSLFEERAKGLYHNSAIVFDTDGSQRGKYRKMHIPNDNYFYEKFYFTPGDNEFKPIKTSLGNLGVLICWDQWFPEAARIMALNGADILIYPTAIGTLDNEQQHKSKFLDAWITIQKSHAIANNIFVASINRVGIEKSPNNSINFWGNSFVCDTYGQTIVSGSQKEEIIYCSIDFAQIEQTRKEWPFLRDRRVDYYDDIKKIYK